MSVAESSNHLGERKHDWPRIGNALGAAVARTVLRLINAPAMLASIREKGDFLLSGLKRIQQIVSHLRLFAHLDEGEVNEAQALQLAHGYLHDNAVGIYQGKVH